LREFAWLGGGMLAVIALAILVLTALADVAAPLVPFEWEQGLADAFVPAADDLDEEDRATQERLRDLARRLAGAMDLDPGMSITVHYLPGGPVNAFASFGGTIVVFEELVKTLPNENALAMVVAHEIAHVRNRDVIRGAGGALLAAAAIAGAIGNIGAIADLAAQGNYLTALYFSRAREEAADAAALAALQEVYGHVGGFEDLFRAFAGQRPEGERPPTFLSSHPQIEERIARLHVIAAERGWRSKARRTPLAP
jgi:predicted Zn-dependent protease